MQTVSVTAYALVLGEAEVAGGRLVEADVAWRRRWMAKASVGPVYGLREMHLEQVEDPAPRGPVCTQPPGVSRKRIRAA